MLPGKRQLVNLTCRLCPAQDAVDVGRRLSHQFGLIDPVRDRSVAFDIETKRIDCRQMQPSTRRNDHVAFLLFREPKHPLRCHRLQGVVEGQEKSFSAGLPYRFGASLAIRRNSELIISLPRGTSMASLREISTISSARAAARASRSPIYCLAYCEVKIAFGIRP